jgi:raffinose/stachyose/melibiose transport system permease protein
MTQRHPGHVSDRREGTSRDTGSPEGRRRALKARRLRRGGLAFILVTPAAIAYYLFKLQPIALTAQYSFYEWDGITEATWVGFENYAELFNNPQLYGSIIHAFQLIIMFSFVPVGLGLLSANLIRGIGTSRLAAVSRTVLFLPQVIPLVAAGIMWQWQLSTDGLVNQFLRLIGLSGVTKAWLGETDTALSAVGVIGAWVMFGLCMILMLAGMTKIDPALYEAARIDGAGAVREFFSITLPSLRQEISVALTVTIIAALASFDIVYIATRGGPANRTSVPGVEIYRLAFFDREIGSASALAVALMLLVLAVVLPLQLINREGDS